MWALLALIPIVSLAQLVWAHRQRVVAMALFVVGLPLVALVACSLTVEADGEHGVNRLGTNHCHNEGEHGDPWECDGNAPGLSWWYSHRDDLTFSSIMRYSAEGVERDEWRNCKVQVYKLGSTRSCRVAFARPIGRRSWGHTSWQINDGDFIGGTYHPRGYTVRTGKSTFDVSSDTYETKEYILTSHWHLCPNHTNCHSVHSLTYNIKVTFSGPPSLTVNGDLRCDIEGLSGECDLPEVTGCPGPFYWLAKTREGYPYPHARYAPKAKQVSTTTPDAGLHHFPVRGWCEYGGGRQEHIEGIPELNETLVVCFNGPCTATSPPAPTTTAQPMPTPAPQATDPPTSTSPSSTPVVDCDLTCIVELQAKVDTLTGERDDARDLLAQRNNELAEERRRTRDLQRQLDAIPDEVEVRVALLGRNWWTGRWYLYSLDGGQWQQVDSFTLGDCTPDDPRTDCPKIGIPTGKPATSG